MNQNMKFLICVRSNEDEINEKKLSSSEEIKKSRSEDFFLVQFLTSLFHASSHCQEERMIYRINFHTLHFRYVSALLSPVAFFFSFKKYPRPSTWNSSIRQYRIGSLVADTGLSSNSSNVDRPRPQCPPT